MCDTIIINLFAGPGTGKSTGAARIFSELKSKNINCELVSEVAKDLVWEENYNALEDQLYVLGEQARRINRLIGKVDVIITDSPILLSIVYNKDKKIDNSLFSSFLQSYFESYNNMNYYLVRVKEYQPKGRTQTKIQAKILDQKIKFLLKDLNIKYKEVEGSNDGFNTIVNDIVEALV
jgi:hypothetical protein